jgi:hypothetical protein
MRWHQRIAYGRLKRTKNAHKPGVVETGVFPGKPGRQLLF